MKVFINPGHAPNGDPDPGAVNSDTGLRESDVADAVGCLVASYLNNVGIETETLQSDSLEEICEKANSSGADLFVSIHCNSYGGTDPNGTETWYYYDDAEGGKLADCIQKQIVESLNTNDRGIKGAKPGVNGLYVLTNTDAPAVLVELAFISNPDDEKLLADKETQDEFAKAIARGVTDYQNL